MNQPLDLDAIQTHPNTDDVAALLTRVRQLEDRLDERTADIAERALENAQLRAENERLRAAWHSATTRASTAREHLDITEHGRDRAVEAAEQLQSALDAAEAVAEDIQRLAAENEQIRAERRPAHFGTPHPSFGEAAGAAMAHNARLADDAQIARQQPAT
ncbi:hypothetical protein ACFC1T_27800 [Kitasatospora sp. NPDC056076]|uniref:hypothetical protein n=1 Tax=Kitasatospora sp. NPDC056076 TaxID=3345703 RepID=UPI0035DF27B0